MKNKKNQRRETIINRLENQLGSGEKFEKINGKTTDKLIKLRDRDIKRVKEEIKILKKLIL